MRLSEQFKRALESEVRRLVERYAFGKCMECDKPPEVECRWADGRGRAWFCQECFDRWKTEESRDIVMQRQVKDGKVSAKYGEAQIREALNRIGQPIKFNKRDIVIEINGRRVPVFRKVVGYKSDANMTPIEDYFVEVAYDWNQSNRVQVRARTLRGLVSALKRERYKLVRPGGR